MISMATDLGNDNRDHVNVCMIMTTEIMLMFA